MKFRITLKTPDAVDYAIADLPEDEQDDARAIARRFVKYGELVTIELDTETQTASVVPVK